MIPDAPAEARIAEIRQKLRQLGEDHQRGAGVPNFAEQIWDECDRLTKVEAESVRLRGELHEAQREVKRLNDISTLGAGGGDASTTFKILLYLQAHVPATTICSGALHAAQVTVEQLDAAEARVIALRQACEALVSKWRASAEGAANMAAQFDAAGDQAGNAFAFLKERRVRTEAADELAALLADVPQERTDGAPTIWHDRGRP